MENNKEQNKLDVEETPVNGNGRMKESIHVQGMYKNWFLEYASYVILERAVPALFDGLKPVQRRILHSMKRMDDGRFNKVANIIGHTMQFHPHGDASIGDAIVNMGQKDLLIETQGNWGDIRTGDGAAAPRYIEARLSKFALEVAFNPQTTHWQFTYDGRQKEPIHLPVKFPLVLAQGAEGIAVGLATKIMPHNFNELIEASIAVLEDKPINILPDFPTGGLADFSNYNQGQRGGKIRLRSKIENPDKKTLVVKSIPYGVTTTSLIDSIVKANDAGKFKIKKVVDNTAKEVEILIELPAGVSPDVTIDALYAFTNCEVSISPNLCVISDEKPAFIGVNELLKICTKNTVDLLKWELQIKLGELSEKLFFSSLEKIFIENRIYRDIEECETWEAVIAAIDTGLNPFKALLLRDVTEEDIIRLTEIKIKRISKYNSFKAEEVINNLQDEIKKVKRHLKRLTEYAIDYFRNLQKKYGAGRERQTEIRSFDNIEVAQVALANQKLYVNREEGFIGLGLKKDEFVSECSDIDDVIAFLKDGRFMVTRIAAKTFVGKNIIHVGVWKKSDDRMVYNMIYYDAKSKRNYAKRFAVTAITRDKHNDLTKGAEGSKTLYFTANPNSESEIVTVYLSPSSKARKKVFDFDFGSLEIKGRGANGNIITKWPIRKISHKEAGASTLGGVDIFYDETIGRLNTEARGKYLGNFDNGGQIFVIYKDGSYELTGYELTNRYEIGTVLLIEQFNPQAIISAVHYDGEKKNFYVKRFNIESQASGRLVKFIGDAKGSTLIAATTTGNPIIEMEYLKGKAKEKMTEQINLNDVVEIKGWKARGNRLSNFRVTYVGLQKNDDSELKKVEEKIKPAEEKQKQEEEQKSKGEAQLDLFSGE